MLKISHSLFTVAALALTLFQPLGKTHIPAVNITVSGTWEYQDLNFISRKLNYARVEVWDSNTGSPHTLLGMTYTNSNGQYQITVSSDEVGGPDIYVKVFARDDYSAWVGSSASNIASAYYAASATYSNVTATTLNIGTLVITDGTYRMAFYIYDLIADDAWNALFAVGWNNTYNVPVQWTPTSAVGTYYSGGKIYMIGEDRWDSDVILHEFGHFVMDKTYAVYPPTSNCNPHTWDVPSSEGCAWSEGWAHFLQAAIQNDKYYVDTEDQSIFWNLELPSPVALGNDVEGAVTASLWDVFDNESESWDRLTLGLNGANSNGIWSIVYNTDPNTAKEFERNWIISANGYNCQVIGIFSHHAIGNARCIYIPFSTR